MPVAFHAAFEALAGARHADPFGVLGPQPEADGVVIRTFQPAAERVEVLAAGGPFNMARHESGTFEATFPDAPAIFDYRLRIIYPGGHAVDIDDPYRYGRVITEYDIY